MSFVGNEQALQQLTSLSQSPPHSLLVIGPPNIGRATAIRHFMQKVICPTACNRCEACSQILGDKHPDARWMAYRVEDVSPQGFVDLVKGDVYRPLTASHRFRIIKLLEPPKPDILSRLLKVLEEPLPNNTIIVIAPSINYLLPTIISRSKVVTFATPTTEQCSQIVKIRWPSAKAEEIDEALYWTNCDLSLMVEEPPAALTKMIETLLAYLWAVRPTAFYEFSEYAAACTENPNLATKIVCEWLARILLAVNTNKTLSEQDEVFVKEWGTEGLNGLLGMMLQYRKTVLGRSSYVNQHLFLEEKFFEIGSKMLC